MFRIVAATERAIHSRERTEMEDRRVALREHRALLFKTQLRSDELEPSEMDEVSLYRLFRKMVKDGGVDIPDRVRSAKRPGKEPAAEGEETAS